MTALFALVIGVRAATNTADHSAPVRPTAVASPAIEGGCLRVVRPPAEDYDICGRLASDDMRRSVLTEDQLADAQDVQSRVSGAVTAAGFIRCRHGQVSSAEFGQCINMLEERDIGPQDLAAVRRSLTEQGFPPETVRLARPDDPAPPGALVYAVKAEGLCIIGYKAPRFEDSYWTAGLLPGGRCLNR